MIFIMSQVLQSLETIRIVDVFDATMKINRIIINFRNRTMSNYYYHPQQTLIKQNSQLLSPVPIQQSPNITLVRGSLTDRSPQDFKNSYTLSSSMYVMQPQIVREVSVKHFHDGHVAKIEQSSVPQTKTGTIQNQRNFSDYQISLNMARGEDNQLPNGGGFNVTNKIGEKIKNKTDLHKSNSRTTLQASDQSSKISSNRLTESSNEGQRQVSKLQSMIDLINGQLSKLTQKWSGHEQRIDRLQKHTKKLQQNTSSVFSTPQMEEINKILSLVERSQQRDDYRKTIKMIDELRVSILELHSEVKAIQESRETMQSQAINQVISTVKDVVLQSFKVKEEEMKRVSDQEMGELRKKIAEVELQWNSWKKVEEEHWGNNITSSLKKFQGKMTTLIYEQHITNIPPANYIPTNAGSLKCSPKADSLDKQNSTIVLTTKTYYLDPDGYLLDKNKFYLLNHRNEQIRLSEKEIALLKKHNIL